MVHHIMHVELQVRPRSTSSLNKISGWLGSVDGGVRSSSSTNDRAALPPWRLACYLRLPVCALTLPLRFLTSPEPSFPPRSQIRRTIT